MSHTRMHTHKKTHKERGGRDKTGRGRGEGRHTHRHTHAIHTNVCIHTTFCACIASVVFTIPHSSCCSHLQIPGEMLNQVRMLSEANLGNKKSQGLKRNIFTPRRPKEIPMRSKAAQAFEVCACLCVYGNKYMDTSLVQALWDNWDRLKCPH